MKKEREVMRQKLDNLYWRMRFRFMGMLEEFLKDEEGDTNMVSMIVLIVIVIALATIFKDQLEGAIKAVFGKLTDFINGGL